MDLDIAILGVVLTAICVLPFVWLHRIKKKGENNLLKSLADFAAKHNCSISKKQVHRDFVLGMDENKGCICFYKKSKDEEVSEFIDLAGVKTCKVINTHMVFNTHDGARKVVEKLELSFEPAGSGSAVTLELYDMYKNVQLSGELQLIEEWADLVNKRLKNKE